MANLNTNDKQILEKLFQMQSGYVLNFSDRTMGEFFRDDVGIDIYDEQYNYASGSKANRMRGFWQTADDALVGQSIIKLIEYIETQLLLSNLNKEDFPDDLLNRGKAIANGLLGTEKDNNANESIKEDQFLNKEFKDISIDKLGFEDGVTRVLNQRIDEIRKCLNAKSSLAVIFLCGSTLEGILLGMASKDPKLFNEAPMSPKDKLKKVKKFPDWTLSNFIDVSRSVNLIGEDVKKFSHSLRDFRNYIHPYQQVSSDFNPDEHTAKICWQVLKAAIYQLSKKK